MQLLTRDEIDSARRLVREHVAPTPTHRWPLLDARLGAEVVKHENHTAVGAFKLRGGVVYLHELRRREPGLRGVVSATRGNHGQSVARAAAGLGLAATIVVPHGNAVDKNRAMRALGATLVVRTGPPRRASSASCRPTRRPTSTRFAPVASSRRRSPRCWPTAWPVACPTPTRWR